MDFQLKQDFAIWVKSSESAQRLSHHTGYCGKDPNKVIGACQRNGRKKYSNNTQIPFEITSYTKRYEKIKVNLYIVIKKKVKTVFTINIKEMILLCLIVVLSFIKVI